jgi:uncharacterized protein (DUF2132 family)
MHDFKLGAMGKKRGSYEAEYLTGTSVRIADREALERFILEWKWHHPLQPSQLDFAGHVARVKDVTFYHGADELYRLEGVPGVWHEENLRPA